MQLLNVMIRFELVLMLRLRTYQTLKSTSDILKELIAILLIDCGGYRSRTDDPLRARQML